MFDLHNDRCEAKKGDLLCPERERERERKRKSRKEREGEGVCEWVWGR